MRKYCGSVVLYSGLPIAKFKRCSQVIQRNNAHRIMVPGRSRGQRPAGALAKSRLATLALIFKTAFASSMFVPTNVQQSCQQDNGTGSQTCNSSGSAWGSCGNLTACNSGFNLQNGACVVDILYPRTFNKVVNKPMARDHRPAIAQVRRGKLRKSYDLQCRILNL